MFCASVLFFEAIIVGPGHPGRAHPHRCRPSARRLGLRRPGGGLPALRRARRPRVGGRPGVGAAGLCPAHGARRPGDAHPRGGLRRALDRGDPLRPTGRRDQGRPGCGRPGLTVSWPSAPGTTVGSRDHRTPRVCARARQALRRRDRGRRHRRGGPAGRGLRVPRPQRRRQELDHADDRLRLPALRRRAAGLRARPGRGRVEDPRAPRRGAAGGHPRHRAPGPRQPAHLRRLLRPPASRRARTRRCGCSTSCSCPTGRRPRSTRCPGA